MSHYLGLGGLPGLDPNPAKHILAYSRRHPEVGIALGDIGHDATAAIVADGRIAFAVEEERLNRSKHFMGLPRTAAEACCRAAGVEVSRRSTTTSRTPRAPSTARASSARSSS
jgi:hypothetical protein